MEQVHKKNCKGSLVRRSVVKIATKTGLYKLGVKLDTKIQERKMKKVFSKYGLETLVKADEALRSVNIEMFLTFGTLLGAYRNKQFIPYDCDLDVGILANSYSGTVCDILKDYGFSLKRQFFIKETNTITEEQYEYKGCQIDIFYYFELDESAIFAYAARRHETKDWRDANETDGFPCVMWPCTKSDFVDTTFLGYSFYMPKKADLWCKEIYGEDFMTPVKNWTVGERKTRMIKSDIRLYRRYFND